MYDDIVRALTGLGATTLEVTNSARGAGRLLLVGYLGHNFLLHIIDPSRTKITTPTEEAWIKSWKGIVFPVETPEQVLLWLRNQTVTP